MESIYIFFVYNGKSKIFRYRGASRREAVEEFQYLYGKDVSIKGIKKMKSASKNHSLKTTINH